jgi:hypothetical protein
MSVVPQLERELLKVARRQAHRQRRFARLRRPLVAAIAAAILLLAAAALAASGLLRSGAPLLPPPGAPLDPDSNLGVVEVGSAQLLPVAVPDPAGGPPWGLRFVRTTRGLGCLQAGRLVRGQIGVIGQDGAFRNDGRFHPLATDYLANGVAGPFPCGSLDARGVSASGLILASSTEPGCLAQHDHGPIGRRPHQPPICPRQDWRLLYLGMAGPEATSITYRAAGATHTVHTAGDQGAYLIVLPASHNAHQLGSYEPLSGAGGGPIVRVDYRNGQVCRLDQMRSSLAGDICPQVGRAPATHPTVTAAQVAAPVTTRLRKAHRGPILIISFVARVAVTDASSHYSFSVRFPGHAPHCGFAEGGAISHNNTPGQLETVHLTTAGCHGRARGTVRYSYGLNGGGLPASPFGRGGHTLTVGHFSTQLP